MPTKFRPLDDNIVIKPAEAEEKSAGGILLPDAAKEKPIKGTVIAVGPGRILKTGKRLEPGVKVGDVVLYGKYAGNDIKIDGVEHKIVREAELLAKVE